MSIYGNVSTATVSVGANTNACTISGLDLTIVSPGMTINFGSRERKAGDAYLIASVAPTGSSGGSLTLVGSVATAYTNAPFLIDTTGYLGTDASYAATVALKLLDTLNKLFSPATNLFAGSRQLILDKVASTGLSRFGFSIAGRSWADIAHRAFSFTPTGGQATTIETLAVRALSDGATPSDALLFDLTNGTGDLRAGSATMVAGATVDLGSAPMKKVAITGGAGVTINSFGAGRNLDRVGRFVDGGATLAHNATSLDLVGGANIVTRAGDRFVAMSDGSGNWRVVLYARADGSPLALGSNAATLDPSTGKLLAAQVPDAVLGSIRYQGGWNASTNAPALPAPSAANKGWYYIVLTAGTTSLPGPFGAITDWQVGDWAVSDGTYWEKVDSSDQVISVAGLQGAITAAQLRSALALVVGTNVAAAGANSDITSLSNLASAQASVRVTAGGLGGLGSTAIVQGDTIRSGFIEWRSPNATRLGYLGFSGTDVAMTLENGAAFNVLSGKFRVNSTTDLGFNSRISVVYDGGGTQFGAVWRPVADNTTVQVFQNAAGTTVGSITQSGSASAFNTSSDGRVKPVEDREPLDVGDVFDRIEPVRYMISMGGEPEPGVGFIAQDLYKVIPEAVTPGDDDDTLRLGDDGFRMWQVDATRIVPFLVAEVKAQHLRRKALEKILADITARLNALEDKEARV